MRALFCYRCHRWTKRGTKACQSCGCVAFFEGEASSRHGYPSPLLDGPGEADRDREAAERDRLALAAKFRSMDGVTARRHARSRRSPV